MNKWFIALVYVSTFLLAVLLVSTGLSILRTEIQEAEPTCERLLLAVPVPLNERQAELFDMEVCGIDLEFKHVRKVGEVIG